MKTLFFVAFLGFVRPIKSDKSSVIEVNRSDIDLKVHYKVLFSPIFYSTINATNRNHLYSYLTLDALVVVLCPKSSRISDSAFDDVLCWVGFTADGKILAVNAIIA